MDKQLSLGIIFILIIAVITMVLLAAFGVLDNSKAEAESRAEFICWSQGYLGGIDKFESIHCDNCIYLFNFTCKTNGIVYSLNTIKKS